MEIEKLIERLKSLYNALKEEGEQKCSPEINTVAAALLDASTALSKLWEENWELCCMLELPYSNKDIVHLSSK